MAIIIGAGTTVGGFFAGQCVTSVNWAFNPNVQRIYCLGDWTPDENRTIRKPTYSLSVTLYSSGNTPVYDTSPDTGCVTTNREQVSVNPASCEGSVSPFDYDDWVITSYGYNKDDPQNPAQESWSLQRWAYTGGGTTIPDIVAPDYIIRGIAEGSVSVEVEDDAGINFDGVTDLGNQGSVSAGAVGRADETRSGVVISVGGSDWTYGKSGSGNVSIPYTPMWM